MTTKMKSMKSYRTATFIAVTSLAVVLFVFWQARELADRKRATVVIRLLYTGIHAYRQGAGHLPSSLDQISVGTGWLRKATNTVSITYDPGSSAEKRMPRLAVSAGHTSIAVQGPGLECPPL